MYKCECGKTYENSQSYVAHCGHCAIHLGYKPKSRNHGVIPWNKGKTKETDERVAKGVETLKRRIAEGIVKKSFLGRTHSESTRQRMSEMAKIVSKEHRNGWKGGDSHVQNKYEVYAENFLRMHNIEFQSEVNVPRSMFGKSCATYQFDFLVKGTIDLEIDGSSHLSEKQKLHDEERDLCVSKLYIVYRIQHHDSIENLENGLNEFLEFLNNA